MKKSLFTETFGATPLVKVIEFFLTYPSFDYTKSYVANDVGISRVTINKIWQQLIKNEIIVKTRTLGNAEMYQLNGNSPRAKVLMRTATELSLNYLSKLKKAEQIAIPS